MAMRWALFGLTVVLFLPTLASYPDVWRAQPYTHGYLIAAATVWLVWRERDALGEADDGWAGPLPAAAAVSMLWLAATVMDTRVVSQTALPILLLLWSAVVFGERAARRLTPTAATFMLAVPLWGVLTRPLQSMTVAATGFAMRLLHIPAEIDGDLVHIASGTFAIEGGCSGLNYLMSGLAIGALYAQTLVTPWRGRLIVVALSAVIPIVGNWLRVSTLIAIGQATRMESIFITEPRPHLYYGWAIFFVGLLIFFPLAGRIARREAGAHHVPPDPSGEALRALHPSRGTTLAFRSTVLASVAVGIGPVLYYAIGALPAHEEPPPQLSPASVQWSLVGSSAVRPYAWEPAFAGADERQAELWTDGTLQIVVDRIYYRDQSQGAELIGFTSSIAPAGDILLERFLATAGPERRIVNEAVVRDPTVPLLVWYWYRVAGVETPSPAKAKLLELWAFVARSRGSELIALSAPCTLDDCSQASTALLAFLGGA